MRHEETWLHYHGVQPFNFLHVFGFEIVYQLINQPFMSP